MRILLVEDDAHIASPLIDTLVAAGYFVEHVGTGQAALAAVDFDMVLLDLGLPDLDGHEVCRRIRQKSRVPVIMLTARSDEFDRVMGLDVGADDYITKPFSSRELLARIRAVSRRLVPSEGQTAPDASEAQQMGRLVVDRRTRRVYLDGEQVEFTAKEFDLLAFLADDPGAVRTRTEILESVWDAHWYGPTKTLDVHVASIRRKLGSNEWINAVRSVGFRLDVPS